VSDQVKAVRWPGDLNLEDVTFFMTRYYRKPMEKVRISKLMADMGLCSRREADAYLAAGQVTVDGQPVGVGDKALPTQKIVLAGNARQQQQDTVTILVHKPIGIVSGQAEQGYLPASTLITPANHSPKDRSGRRFRPEHKRGLAVAGRLDIDSTGLLVLTQDGRVARRLIGQDTEIEKEYLVRVRGKLSPGGLQMLRNGLSLDGKALKPAQVDWQNEDQLQFVLREGRKRQIRRMCELVGLAVVGLKRVRIGQVRLADLEVGRWRYLQPEERF
jgi:23S rRNA pseudouridine2604 synthase